MYGVPLNSYWFGAISFLSILCVLAFTYFVLKSGVKKASKNDYAERIHVEKEVGIVTITPQPKSNFNYIVMISLLIIELYFNIVFITGVIQDFNQQTAASALGLSFLIWGFILYLYRIEFLPSALMEKKRKEKAIPERKFKFR